MVFPFPRPKADDPPEKQAATLQKSTESLKNIITATQKWWADGPSEKEGMIQVLRRGRDGSVRLFNLFGRTYVEYTIL
jgi:hypothetical protein